MSDGAEPASVGAGASSSGRVPETVEPAVHPATSAGASRAAADLAFTCELAERAGRLVHERYERLERIDHKSARDVVTEVDHLSEELILEAIRARYPGDAILAEESGTHAASLHGVPGHVAPGDAARALAHGRTWIVDPVDGTINYANGIPFFCVSIGLVIDGRPTVGAVHDPMRSETFAATADGPALLDGVPVVASDKEKLSDYVVSLALGGRAVASRARALRRTIRVSRSMGSAALALAYVANGRFDAFVQSGGMSAWDVAAAGLIAERAGALVTDSLGGSWFDVDKASRAFGIVASPPAHHPELLRLSRE
jgi:fructose-1,6-bisphosphatase/inositol monophosphatase family enzyme